MGWLSNSTKQNICIIRLWNRIVSMSDERLPKLLFNYMYEKDKSKWLKYIKNLLFKTGHEQAFHTRVRVNIHDIKTNLHDQYKTEWESNIYDKPKLRTYVKFKYEYGVEPYVSDLLSKGQRSILAQFRCGILPLKIETGRYVGIEIAKRKCELCDFGELEDELHFLVQCPHYDDYRECLFNKAKMFYTDFDNIPDDVKMVILMSDSDLYRDTATYLICAYKKRNTTLFN